MTVRRKKRGIVPFLVLFFILLLLAGTALALALLRPKGDPALCLDAAREELLDAVGGESPGLEGELAGARRRCFSLRAEEPFRQKLRSASGTVKLTFLDDAILGAGLSDEMQKLLQERASSAKRSAELYAENGAVLPSVGEALYESALRERLAHAEDYCRAESVPVTLRFDHGGWSLTDPSVFRSAVQYAPRPGYETSLAALAPVPLHYTLPLTGPGPVPDAACYGESDDPQVIARLLESETARRLIGGQTLDFDPNRDMLGRTIYYYLDETILVLVWQQDENGSIGTFAEVLIADASQLRRKIADDEFGTYQCYYATELGAQANAVLTCSGDYYNNGRSGYGLCVYEGQLMRCGLQYGQSCLFDANGDMLFVYENAFADEEEARRFIEDHQVWFSLSWGPVLVDHGVDVTPYDYYYGEVLDTYARSVIGQLGQRHYLMMTLNQEFPDHPYLATLRQAADVIIAHGCFNAYTLDGGQTASIILGGRLINPVQFGYERLVSDVFYFATALPEN